MAQLAYQAGQGFIDMQSQEVQEPMASHTKEPTDENPDEIVNK
jgi:hypothetical protein